MITPNTSEFLAEFFQSGEPVNYRAFPPRGKSGGAVKTTDESRLSALNETSGIYFVVNSGGDRDEEITKFNAFFMEIDGLSFGSQKQKIDASPLPPAIRVRTKKSMHSYWPIEGPCTRQEWEDMQARLIHFFDSDPSIKNPSRVMRVPGYDHIDDAGNRRTVAIREFTQRKFTLAEMQAAYPTAPVIVADRPAARHENDGNDDLRAAITAKGKLNTYGNIDMKCPAHNGTSLTSAATLIAGTT